MFTRVLRSDFDASVLWGILKKWKESRDEERPLVVTVSEWEPRRSTDQNAMLWAVLTDFSEQLEWPINGRLTRMDPEDWKDVLSASFKSETVRLSQTTDGRVVMLGLRTSKMKKAEFTEFLEFLLSVAAERGVVLTKEEAV